MAAGPRKPTPPMSAGQRRREVARLVVRLDEMLKATSDMAVRARARVSIGGLNRYRRFAKRVRDFFALAAVAEEKLYDVPELAESPMATALDRMHARMVVLFVEGSAAFFDLYRRVTELPLGAHEMCGVELRGLREISKFLDDERYDGERGQALRRKAERVAEMMLDVMDRIEPLEDFGDLPSISPKGANRQPTKAPARREREMVPQAPVQSPTPEPEAEWRPDDWRWMEQSEGAGGATAPMGYGDVPDGAGAHYASAPAGHRGEDGEHGDVEEPGGDWTADGEYVDDDGRFDEAPDWVDEDDAGEDRAGEDGATGGTTDEASAPEPSPLVRELTLDMVEAEERRAALNERLAASGRVPANPPAAPAAAAGVPARAPFAARSGNSGASAPSGNPGASAPSGNPGASAPSGNSGASAPSVNPPIKSAPFRSPTTPRPPKRR